MITIGQIRQIVRQWLWKLCDPNILSIDDIRYVKGNGGVFPSRIITNPNGEVKEMPYSPQSDIFMTYDVESKADIGSEFSEEANEVSSMWPLSLIINVYGRDSDYLIQYMRGKLHSYFIHEWLNSQNMTFEKIPDEILSFDSFENNEYWFRRRMVLNFNISQTIGGIFVGDENEPMKNIEFNNEQVEVVGGE